LVPAGNIRSTAIIIRRNSMKPEHSKAELERRIAQLGVPLGGLTPMQAVRLMLDFYRDVRFAGCGLDDDGDMLSVEWGVFDFGDGPNFQFDLSRQFISTDDPGKVDDDAMSQLKLTFHYTPTVRFEDLADDNQWCRAPDELTEFESLIVGSDAFREACAARSVKVTLEYNNV